MKVEDEAKIVAMARVIREDDVTADYNKKNDVQGEQLEL